MREWLTKIVKFEKNDFHTMYATREALESFARIAKTEIESLNGAILDGRTGYAEHAYRNFFDGLKSRADFFEKTYGVRENGDD